MKYLAIFISGLAIVVMSSCANNNGGNFPQYVDAPPFDFPNGEELRSRMHQLAFSHKLLVRLIEEPKQVAQPLKVGCQKHPLVV